MFFEISCKEDCYFKFLCIELVMWDKNIFVLFCVLFCGNEGGVNNNNFDWLIVIWYLLMLVVILYRLLLVFLLFDYIWLGILNVVYINNELNLLFGFLEMKIISGIIFFNLFYDCWLVLNYK